MVSPDLISESIVIRKLSELSAQMAEGGNFWREDREQRGEGTELPTLLLDLPEMDSFLIQPGASPKINSALDESASATLRVKSPEIILELFQGNLSPQSAVHVGQMVLEGDARALWYITQMMEEAWGSKMDGAG